VGNAPGTEHLPHAASPKTSSGPMSATDRVAALGSRSTISGWAATSPLKTAHDRVRRRLDYPASLALDHARERYPISYVNPPTSDEQARDTARIHYLMSSIFAPMRYL